MANSAAKIALQLQKLSNEATEKSFKYNTQEANTARAWQKDMSDTSHQREVKDLVAAGLNPVLSSGGSGAQSYTTSSASAQAENAANAVGNVWSSQISADATRAAAAQSAAAMKAAAATQAAAQRYAASLAYQAKIEGYKNNLEVTKIKGEYAVKTSGNSVGGILNKVLEKSGAYDILGTKSVKGVINDVKKLFNDPKKYFKNQVNDFASTFKKGVAPVLTSSGRVKVDNSLSKLGIRATPLNRRIYVQAASGNKVAQQNLMKLLKPKQKANSARLNSNKWIMLLK